MASFAGEDRAYAERLSNNLEEYQLAVFYDKTEESRILADDVEAVLGPIQPLMGPLQEKLDKVLYPNVAEDAATVRELIDRFEGRQGMYFLQTGPGFTRRRLASPQMQLVPRVLHFAATHQDESESGS